MIGILEGIFLGIVQGITEWLPISSSGHLALIQTLMGIEQPIVFDVILHLGSLLVIIAVFWKDLIEITKGVFALDKKYLKQVSYLVLGSVPIAIVGLIFNDFIKAAFGNLLFLGVAWLFTAAVLLLSRYPLKKEKEMGLKSAIIMGVAQAIAILPGVSRSGSTISVGLMQGIKKEEAAKFSFLLAIPAILGAGILELRHIDELPDLTAALAGALAAVISGYLSLKLILKLIKSGKFSIFAWYCLFMGLFAIGYHLFA